MIKPHTARIGAERVDLLRWVALCAVGEFLGIATAATWYGTANAISGEPVSVGQENVILRLLFWAAGGLVAGACVGCSTAVAIARLMGRTQ